MMFLLKNYIFFTMHLMHLGMLVQYIKFKAESGTLGVEFSKMLQYLKRSL